MGRLRYDEVSAESAVTAAANAVTAVQVATHLEDRAVRTCLAYGYTPRAVEQLTGVSKSRADRIGRSALPSAPKVEPERQELAAAVADLVWAHTGGAPTGDVVPTDDAARRPTKNGRVLTVLLAGLCIALAAMVGLLTWQQTTMAEQAGAQTKTLVEQQHQAVEEADARTAAVAFVTSYLVGAGPATCTFEGRTGEDYRRCVHWEGDTGGETSSPPAAVATYPYRAGYAIVVQFRLQGGGDPTAGRAVYVRRVEDSWTVPNSAASGDRTDGGYVTGRLDQTQLRKYPPI